MASESGGQPAQVVRNCISCGRPIDFNANVCPYCGYDYRVQTMGPPPIKKTNLPVAAGILVLLAGLLAIGNGVFYLLFPSSSLGSISLPPGVTQQDVENILQVCGSIEVIFGLVAIMGGVFAVQRKHFGLAIVGAVLGMLSLGFTFGGIFGFIGLILVAVSRKEFS